MAYLNHLFAIAPEHISSCCSWNSIRARATKAVACSHFLAYGVEVQPLGELLGRAFDGGKVLAPEWRHPLRVPTVHQPADVVELDAALQAGWLQVIAEHGQLHDDDWYKCEIEKLVDVFSHAAQSAEAIISIIEQSTHCRSVGEETPASSILGRIGAWLRWR